MSIGIQHFCETVEICSFLARHQPIPAPKRVQAKILPQEHQPDSLAQEFAQSKAVWGKEWRGVDLPDGLVLPVSAALSRDHRGG